MYMQIKGQNKYNNFKVLEKTKMNQSQSDTALRHHVFFTSLEIKKAYLIKLDMPEYIRRFN
jgi:hypothetical protein